MSSITNVILITTHDDGAKKDGEHPNIYTLNEHLMQSGYIPGLAKVDCHSGGNKRMSTDIWIGAFDKLDVEKFKNVFESIKWEDPECLQLMIRERNEKQFQIFTPASTSAFR